MPIDIAVQGWCEDTFAVIAVNGEINADSCAVFARPRRGPLRPH